MGGKIRIFAFLVLRIVDFVKSSSCEAILKLLQLPVGSTGPVRAQASTSEKKFMIIH